MDNKIIMKQWKEYETKGGNWSKIKHDYSEYEISKKMYDNFNRERWKGDRCYWSYTALGYTLYRLTNAAPSGEVRSVREFTVY